jgi:hypothetical protein
MRFYTRELYQRGQSEDTATLNAAEEEWERVNEAYEQHLRAIEPLMPPSVREMNAILLHDAEVRSISRQGKRLLMVLLKDIPPRDLVLLDYGLAAEPVLEPFTPAPGDWSRPTDFLYDELDVVEGAGGPIFTQGIIFGNGWLLRLRFRDARVPGAVPLSRPEGRHDAVGRSSSRGLNAEGSVPRQVCCPLLSRSTEFCTQRPQCPHPLRGPWNKATRLTTLAVRKGVPCFRGPVEPDVTRRSGLGRESM